MDACLTKSRPYKTLPLLKLPCRQTNVVLSSARTTTAYPRATVHYFIDAVFVIKLYQ